MKSLSVILLVQLFASNSFASSLDNKIRIQKRSSIKMSETTSEDFNEEKQTLLNRKRVVLIQDIKKFIREAKSNDQKAELNLRLGSLYMEEYHYLLAKAQARFEKESIAASKLKNKALQAPSLDTSEAMASLEKARVIYKDLLERFPTHPRKDEMLYFLALLTQDRGNANDAIQFLARLVKETPSSRFVAEALLQLGDHYFEKNNFRQAEEYFDRVLAANNPKTVPYAMYKKAWCAYNNQQYSSAIAQFKAVIELESAENSNYLMRLKNESLRDIALPFVELHKGEEAMTFYLAQGEPFNRSGLESMANLFLEKADYKNSIYFNETLLGLDPTGKKNPDYDLALIEALRLSGNTQKSISRLFSQLPNYMQGSSWYELNSSSPETVKGAAGRFEESARKYALELHAEGQKTKNDALYENAKSLYQKYLEFFANSTHAPTIRFYLAEILYKQEQYVAAADHYYTVFKNPTAGNLRVDSIHYALMALDKEMNARRKKEGLSEISKSNTAKLKENEEASAPTPFNPVEKRFVTVGEDYVSKFPKAKDTADILYQLAYLNYSHFNLPEAYKAFWGIVQSYPGHPTSYSSAGLILDILNRKKEYNKLVAACQKFLATNTLSKSDFRNEVSGVLRHSELKRIQLLEEKGSYKEAALAYVEYTKAYGAQDEALYEKALYNASVNFYKMGAVLPALENQERFLRRFTQSPLKENMLLQVAKTYEGLANFEKAASYFEQFAAQYPNNKQAVQALRLSGLYYWGAKNETKAEYVMKHFIAKYPNESAAVNNDLLELYETQGAKDKLVRYYLESRSRKGVSYAQYLSDTLKIAEIQGGSAGRLSPKTMEEALKISQRFHKELIKTKPGIEQTAKVLFWFATQKESVFNKIKLSLPQRTLELNLKRKLALLKEMENEFSSIAKLGGGDWGLGAIYKTASAYRSLAQDINQAPVPAELTGEQLEQYRTELKRQMVTPFTEKAVNLVGQCLDKAQEFNLLSQWTTKCYSLGSEINSERYPAIKTFFLPSLRVAVMENGKSSKIEQGYLKNYPYPFDSTAMFNPPSNRALSSVPSSLPMLFDGGNGFGGETHLSTPNPFNYALLDNSRKDILNRAMQENKTGKQTTFGFLHYLRMVNPEKALPAVLQAIQSDTNNMALHNLLGLCYLDVGNYTSAKVTWLSMIARGLDSAEVQNNLGVLYLLQGKEKQAIDFFKEAAQKENALEAWTNLGFLSLKYRNGFEAKQFFQKATTLSESDVPSRVGFGVALIQNREFEAAKDSLAETSSTFKEDPFAKLTFSYLLLGMDEVALARQTIENYSRGAMNLDRDSNFRQLIQELRKGSASSSPAGETLPSL